MGEDPDTPVVVGNRVWVTNTASNSVSVLDVNIGKPAGPKLVPVGRSPRGSPSARGRCGSRTPATGAVTRIDAATGRTDPATIAVGHQAYNIAFGEGHVWATSAAEGTVTRIDPNGQSPPLKIRLETGPAASTVGGGAVWVANADDNTVSKVDPKAGRQTATVKVPEYPFEMTYGAGRAFVSSRKANRLSRIDPKRLKVTGSIKPGAEPIGIAVAGDKLWIACWKTGGIRPIQL